MSCARDNQVEISLTPGHRTGGVSGLLVLPHPAAYRAHAAPVSRRGCTAPLRRSGGGGAHRGWAPMGPPRRGASSAGTRWTAVRGEAAAATHTAPTAAPPQGRGLQRLAPCWLPPRCRRRPRAAAAAVRGRVGALSGRQRHHPAPHHCYFFYSSTGTARVDAARPRATVGGGCGRHPGCSRPRRGRFLRRTPTASAAGPHLAA